MFILFDIAHLCEIHVCRLPRVVPKASEEQKTFGLMLVYLSLGAKTLNLSWMALLPRILIETNFNTNWPQRHAASERKAHVQFTKKMFNSRRTSTWFKSKFG